MAISAAGTNAFRDLGLRFNVVGLLPSVAGVFAILLLVRVTSQEGFGFQELAQEVAELGWAGALLAVALALLVAFVLQPLQYGLVQFVEGYWPSRPFSAWVARKRTERHITKRAKWEDRADPDPADYESPAGQNLADWAADQLRMRYPEEDRVMPTALGNALRAAEDRPHETYGISAVDLWPRIYVLVPTERQALLENGVLQMDIAVRYFVTFLVVGVASFGIVLARLIFDDAHWGWLIIPIAELGLSMLSYRGALSKAIDHGVDIEVTFDLHRFHILEEMRISLPSPRTERHKFAQLSRQIRGELLPEAWLPSYSHRSRVAARKTADP